MSFELPKLPYALDALSPHMSKETLEFHYGKHHQTYVSNLNNLVKGTEFEKATLEEIIKKASGGIYNNAAQIWNHTFFWNCLTPKGGGEPTGKLLSSIEGSFGSYQAFKDKFTDAAKTLFGSGWVFLVDEGHGALKIVQEGAAGNPLKNHQNPILTLDVWEHAYYIDHRNARVNFIEAFWKLVNWEFAASNLTHHQCC